MTTLDLDGLLASAREQIASLFSHDDAARAFRDTADAIDDHIPYERYRQLRLQYMRVDEIWASSHEPHPKTLARLVDDFKALARQQADEARAPMLEARIAQIRRELRAAAPRATAAHPLLGEAGAIPLAPEPDAAEVAESRRPLEARAVDDVCATTLSKFCKALDRHVAELQRASAAARTKAKEVLVARLDLVHRARAAEFDRLAAADRDEARARKYRTYGSGLQRQAAGAESELKRASMSAIARLTLALADPATYTRTRRLLLLALLLAGLCAAGLVLWQSETAAALIDPAEAVEGPVAVNGVMVRNLRVAPVRPSYESRFREMLARAEPATPLADLQRGFFESEGRNVSVARLRRWLDDASEACACAQYLGIDRFVAHVRGTMLCDPALLSCSAESARARAGDWLGEGVYTVPTTARVEYTASEGAAAGRRVTVQLDRAGVACVLRCADLARTPVACPPKE